MKTVFLPVRDLPTNGVAHLPLLNLKRPFSTGSPAHDWLLQAPIHERLRQSKTQGELRRQIGEYFRVIRRDIWAVNPTAVFQTPVLQCETSRIFNQWHYDRPNDAGKSRFHFETVKPEERCIDVTREALVTLSFPSEVERPTIAMPWGGEHKDCLVQGPMGHATVLFSSVMWHSGDRTATDPQGIVYCSVRW
jgi:hypothetical protein